jgi:hypothetical protein
MFKNYFVLALVVAVVSSLISGIYTYNYYKYLFDFSSVLPIWKIIASYFSISLIATGLRFLFDLMFQKFGELFFNIVLSFLTILSIMHPILLNGDFEMAEMYPGFAIPIYFIFTIIWLALASTFIKKTIK